MKKELSPIFIKITIVLFIGLALLSSGVEPFPPSRAQDGEAILPDLIINTMVVNNGNPAYVTTENETKTISVDLSIKNQGQENSTGFNVSLYLDYNLTVSYFWTNLNLTVDETYNLTTNMNITGIGEHLIQAIVDQEDIIEEEDETNNNFARQISIMLYDVEKPVVSFTTPSKNNTKFNIPYSVYFEGNASDNQEIISLIINIVDNSNEYNQSFSLLSSPDYYNQTTGVWRFSWSTGDIELKEREYTVILTASDRVGNIGKTSITLKSKKPSSAPGFSGLIVIMSLIGISLLMLKLTRKSDL